MKPLKKIHLRVAIGAAILMVALLVWIFQMDGMSYVSAATR